VNRVDLHQRGGTVYDSGVESLTLRFKWAPYAGHHLVGGRVDGLLCGQVWVAG